MDVTCRRCFDFSADSIRSFCACSYLNSVLVIVCRALSWNIYSRTIGSSKNFVCLMYSSQTRLTETCLPLVDALAFLEDDALDESVASWGASSSSPPAVSAVIDPPVVVNYRLLSTCFRMVAIVDECRLLRPTALHF